MWAAIAGVIAEILKVLFPALIEAWKKERQPTAEVSAPNPVKDAFREKVLSSRWKDVPARTALCVLILVVCLGCAGTRTIYVPDGEPVKLAADIPNADVWVLDKDGTPVRGRITLHEGWFCAPVPGK